MSMLEQQIKNLMKELKTKAELGQATSIRNPIKFGPQRRSVKVTVNADNPWDALVSNVMASLRDFQSIEVVESILYQHKGLDRLQYEWYIGFNPLESQMKLW